MSSCSTRLAITQTQKLQLPTPVHLPGLHRPGPQWEDAERDGAENGTRLFQFEFLIASTYNPDWRRIVASGVSIGVLAGRRSGDAFYARSTIEQAKVLGCERPLVAGHHAGFEVEPEAFKEGLEEMIVLLKR